MSQPRIIDFMGQRKLTAIISTLLVIGSLISLAVNGLVFGLDFTGGTQIEVGYRHPAELDKIRGQLRDGGFKNPIVVNFGSDSDVLIRLQAEDSESVDHSGGATGKADLSERIARALSVDGDEAEIRRLDYVGPQMGDELRDDGGLGMLAALAVVMLYVAIRFQYKFALGAVLALIHDVIITLGLFSITGLEFDLVVLAAILALIGYSLNDTIVVFDRMRENFRLLRGATPVEVINESLTQTLSRTIVTGLTTLLVLLALFYLGGDVVHNFSVALIFGIIVGTYSSIYVASSLLLSVNTSREDLLPPVKEGAEIDEMP